MFSIITVIAFSLISMFLLISLYLDIKFRKIPNVYLKKFLALSVILNVIEFVVLKKIEVSVLIFKIIFLILIFLISFLLYVLKIIGGSDGKLIILIFLTHPVKFLNFSVIISFFLLFSLLYLLGFFFNSLTNTFTKNSFAFNFLFAIDPKISILKRFYFKMFYNFKSSTKIRDFQNKKYLIISSSIIYNFTNRKFQILIQYRIPLVLFLLLSYLILFLLIIVI